jgi:plastocyanin
MRRAGLAFALLLLAVPAQAEPGARTVDIPAQLFQPDRLVALVGDTVTWTNDDSITHTVTADDATFDSGLLDPEQQFSFTFTRAGHYMYQCTIHRFMRGEIDVFTLSLSGPTRAIQLGATAVLRGLAPLGVGRVEIDASSGRQGGFRLLTIVDPALDGSFSLTVTPDRSTRYRAVATGLESPVVSLRVSPRISLAASSARGGVVLTVRTIPAQAAARVALEVYARELFAWVPAAKTRLDRHSQAVFRLAPSRPLHVRAELLEADRGYAPGVSNVVVIGSRLGA